MWNLLSHIKLLRLFSLPARNLLLNNVQNMQNLLTQVNIRKILQFLRSVIFITKLKDFCIFTFFLY